MSNFERQKAKFRNQPGFIAALDQSGGSTPKALKLYGIPESGYSGEGQMMDLIHAMRSRIVTSPSFNGDRVLAAILFENTMDRQIEGRDTADYLWNVKRVVPILKVDKGLEAEANGVQLMKPMPDLDKLLARAKAKGIFGTKMRSVIKQANPAGIKAIVDQQFEVGRQIIAAGLVPIIEPEVDIHCPDKAAAEALLHDAIKARLDQLPEGELVMLKLTIPSKDNLYADLIAHPRVLKVVALSGGYSRREANERLARQKGMIASFSRALTEGLTAQQSADEFDAALDDDLNVSAGLAATFDLVRDLNRRIDARILSSADATMALETMDDLDAVLGIGPESVETGLDTVLADLLERRAAARQARDWATSDRLRDELAAAGILVEDTRDGQRWRRAEAVAGG